MSIEHIRALKLAASLQKEQKKRKPISKIGAKKKALNNGSLYGIDLELELWFKKKMKSSKVCENCGTRLSSLNEVDWKGSQHHILEKSLFQSVKTHELNHLVLGRWCCHPTWHQSMDAASKMLIFQHAKRKVQMFIDEVLETHKSLEYYK